METIHYNYITTNIINGKQYVGARSTNNINNDKYLGSGNLIKEAIKEFGKENFVKKILCKYKTRGKAFHNERIFISIHNTLIPNGYNLSPTGGSNNCNGSYPEEAKQKIREKAIGRKPTEETRKKISEGKKGGIPWNKGLTKETDGRVKKGSKANIGKHKDKSWNKGLTKETDSRLKRISEITKGRKKPKEYIKHSLEAKLKKGSIKKSNFLKKLNEKIKILESRN